jgi:predicted signal transduction protein with EAL and GGDEF domain
MSGDELLVIADPMHEEDGAAGVAERVMAVFAAPFAIGARTVVVSCSVGTSGFPRDSGRRRHAASLRRHRDARSQGRGTRPAPRVRFPMDRRAHDRLLVESGLRPGMARGELRLAYQPKFDLATRSVTGLEALVRWNHPQLGELAPARLHSHRRGVGT